MDDAIDLPTLMNPLACPTRLAELSDSAPARFAALEDLMWAEAKVCLVSVTICLPINVF